MTEMLVADANLLIKAAESELAGICDDGQGHWYVSDRLLDLAKRIVKWAEGRH